MLYTLSKLQVIYLEDRLAECLKKKNKEKKVRKKMKKKRKKSIVHYGKKTADLVAHQIFLTIIDKAPCILITNLFQCS